MDSKLGLLFSYTINPSDGLMKEIKKILSDLKPGNIINDDLKVNLIKMLEEIELSMKLELGIFIYTDPLKIIKKFILPEGYRKSLANMTKDQAKLKKIKTLG